MASAPSPSSFPAKSSESISPTASQTSPPPPSPPVSLTSPPISQPNATPTDNPAPPLASPPLSSPPLSPPLPLLSPPPPLLSPPPPPLPSPSPPLPSLSPPPPVPTVPTLSPPPPQTTTPSPPLPSSPPLSPPPLSLSPPPPSQPTPTVPTPTVPPPKSSPFSPPPPKRNRPNSPPLSSPPPSSPSLSTPPPLPSPTTNSSVSQTTPPPMPQFPLATPTSQNGTISQTTPDSNSSNSSKNSNTDFNQGGNSNNSTSSNSGGSGLGLGASISIAIVTTFLLASFLVAGVLYIKKKRKPINGYNSVFIMPSPITTPSSKLESPLARFPPTPFGYNSGSQNLVNSKYFSYEELQQITEGFSVNNVLGEGGFGIVYKGVLGDGRQVAVKRLTAGGGQGEREFQAEVEIISRVHHRHLVSLVGYCMDNEQRVLVYDFVPNNTLHFHLHGKDRPVLEWKIRVKIAAGAARGIAYLHEDCHPRIIHRDIKSSNILLDDEFEALVADFGLARLAMDACTHVTTRVMGTFGYLAPEYASSGKLTERSDVFSFGVVLLELITGRRPVDSARDDSLVEWARPLLGEAIESGKLDGIIDPRLEKNYDEVEMLRMIEAAAACVRHSSSHRPKMSQVVRVLDSLADVDLTNGVQPGKSELFNVANSAEIRLFQRMAFGKDFDYSSEFSQHTSASLNSNSNLNPNLNANLRHTSTSLNSNSNLNRNLNANSNLNPNLSANLRSDYRRL